MRGRHSRSLSRNHNIASTSAGRRSNAPPGAGRSGKDLVSPMFNGNDGSSETSVFVRGVHTTGPDGVDKRSIIIYTGSDVTDAQPGKPNNRIACGTFEPAQPFEF